MLKSKDGILKRGLEIKLNMPKYGDFGGGTQPPVYLDRNNNKIPEKQTKWFKSKKITKK